MVMLLMVVAFAVGRALLLPGLWPTVTGDAFFITAIIAFGMISQEVSSGAAQMILVRPVGRLEYVMSLYVATCVAALAVSLAELGMVATIANLRGLPTDGQLFLFSALEIVAKVVSTAAVVTLLSSMARGLADLGIYALIVVSDSLFNFLATFGHQVWAKWIKVGLGWLLTTGITSGQLRAGGSELGKAVARLAVTVVGCVALGHLAVRRRELTYSD